MYPSNVSNCEPKHKFFFSFSAVNSKGQTVQGSFVYVVDPDNKEHSGKKGPELEELEQLERYHQRECKVVSQCYLEYKASLQMAANQSSDMPFCPFFHQELVCLTKEIKEFSGRIL